MPGQPPPCVGHADLYDTALFDDATPTDRQQAIHRAAALCASCPTQCDQIVTADTKSAPLLRLEADWTPPQRREAAALSLRKASGGRRPHKPRIGVDFEHYRPDQRVAVWARMAAERAEEGMPPRLIADELCVSVEVVGRLLETRRGTVAA
ncbi:hypothetical protein ACKI1J_15055 [Streptomyces scabiei]|uniref:hypothetical protein n=1 Tax=Streptomyces scabiei TaxID=1930 RepID=UPI0038F6EF96